MNILKKIGIFILSIPIYVILVVATAVTIILGCLCLIVTMPFIWLYYLITKGWKGVLNESEDENDLFTQEWLKRNGYDE